MYDETYLRFRAWEMREVFPREHFVRTLTYEVVLFAWIPNLGEFRAAGMILKNGPRGSLSSQ
jgi:hypothetical protein